jgi:dienelactone hydrolase
VFVVFFHGLKGAILDGFDGKYKRSVEMSKAIKIIFSLLVAVFAGGMGAAAENQVGPWDLDVLYKAPAWTQSDAVPAPGMTGILYDSIPYKGSPVQVFAYYSAPDGTPPAGGWPAVVCVHGGGGTAFDFWVKAWNEHGYAAISMDLEGHFPKKGKDGRLPTPNPGPERAGVFNDYAKPIAEQWYYHASAQIVLAHSLIASFPEVNAEKIGITGVSWGGTLTSTIMGVDSRFKFAIPGYGCGFLSGSSGHQGRAIEDGQHTEVVDTHFDGRAYFANVTCPTLWVNGMNDFHFDMPATQQSARSVRGPVTMRFEHGMKHGHGPVVQTEECYLFADSVVKSGIPLVKLGRPTAENNVAQVAFSTPLKIKGAQLFYTADSSSIWPDKEWRSAPVAVGDQVITGTLPAGTYAFCFTVTDERNAMVSSEFLLYSVAGEASDDTADTGAVNFSKLYKKATSVPCAKILIADDFEAEISAAVTRILNLEDPAGTAGILAWYDQVASGGRSLQITNSKTVKHAHQPALSQWMRGAETIKEGTINLDFDLFVPIEGGAPLSVYLRDYTQKPSKNYVSMTCGTSNLSVNGKTLQVAEGEWVHYAVSLPVGKAKSKLGVTATDAKNGTQTIEVPVENCNAISWVGLFLAGKNDGKLFMDNLVLTVTP